MKSIMNKKGFTLIELIIVLAVIAIIIGVVIPTIQGMQEEANLTRAEQELNTLRTAVQSYFRHNDAYPVDVHATLTGATPAIITAILSDPFQTDATTTPDTYGYGTGTDAEFGDYYFVFTRGPNGVNETAWDGTADCIDVTGDDIGMGNANECP
ncbi:competence type IV pilus minor pilin ComGE [Bdellovibrionota bacterium]